MRRQNTSSCSRLTTGILLLLGLLTGCTPEIEIAGTRLEVLRRGESPRRYLHIHGDETTAREVLLEHMQSHAGVAYLIKNRQREITLLGARLDPNRMFSREGAQRNLRRLNPGLSEARLLAVLEFLEAHRERLIAAVFPPAGGTLFVLHNNSRGYSVQEEIPISDEVWLPRREEPHEFFLTTSRADFEILKSSPYNAVLQENPVGQDDGSLSRLAARRGVRYVNLEAALGKKERQQEMLLWLEQHLPPIRTPAEERQPPGPSASHGRTARARLEGLRLLFTAAGKWITAAQRLH